MCERMPMEKTSASIENIRQTDPAYGCVFCVTGKERWVAERIEKICPGAYAITARKVKFRTFRRVKTREEEIVLPGYVFFRAPSCTELPLRRIGPGLIRVLMSDDNKWKLEGEDESFAKWLFSYDGLLGLSDAYKEGERVRIVSGPLKDMEGKIRRVDKRGHSGQVILTFGGRSVPVWLGFELIRPVDAGVKE